MKSKWQLNLREIENAIKQAIFSNEPNITILKSPKSEFISIGLVAQNRRANFDYLIETTKGSFAGLKRRIISSSRCFNNKFTINSFNYSYHSSTF